MAVAQAMKEAMGSRRGVLGLCLSLDGRQVSLRVTLKCAPQLECTLGGTLCTSYVKLFNAL